MDGRALRRLTANLSLAAVYVLFAYAHLTGFAQHHRPSLAMMAAVETLIVAAALTRREPQAVRRDWATVVTASCGAFLPLLLRPADEASDLPLATALQLAGLVLQVAALVTLRRSFGVLPADRGLVTGGLYGLVRHPLYLAYMLSQGGYLLNNPSGPNLVILATAAGFQLLRIRGEEDLLGRNEAYVAYARSVPYRLLPGVW
jgi:protein-S-isoprenylcysteine O-methyltransferase Ste14